LRTVKQNFEKNGSEKKESLERKIDKQKSKIGAALLIRNKRPGFYARIYGTYLLTCFAGLAACMLRKIIYMVYVL